MYIFRWIISEQQSKQREQNNMNYVVKGSASKWKSTKKKVEIAVFRHFHWYTLFYKKPSLGPSSINFLL